MASIEYYTPKNGTSGHELGDITDDIRRVILAAPQYADIARHVLEDPALPRVADKIRTLQRLEQSKTPGIKGIGLGKLDFALDAAIAFKKNPWLKWLALGVLLGAPFAIGYLFGRRR